MRQQSHGFRADVILAGLEQSSGNGFHCQRLEKTSSDAGAAQLLGDFRRHQSYSSPMPGAEFLERTIYIVYVPDAAFPQR